MSDAKVIKKNPGKVIYLFASLFLLIGSQGGKKGPTTTWINLGSKFRVKKINFRRFWCSAIIFQVWKQAKVKKKTHTLILKYTYL